VKDRSSELPLRRGGIKQFRSPTLDHHRKLKLKLLINLFTGTPPSACMPESTVAIFEYDCANTRNVGVGGMRMEKLLGYREIVGNTLEYIKETKRFDF
jgi:hypothetical protein